MDFILLAILAGSTVQSCIYTPEIYFHGSPAFPTQGQMEALKGCSQISIPNRDDLTLKKNPEGCFEGQDGIGDIQTKFKICKVGNKWYFMDGTATPSIESNQTVPLEI